MKTLPTVGIDMAKLKFVAALRFDRERCLKAEFDNCPRGFQKLRTWLRAHGGGGSLRIAVESTSTYAEALVEWFHERGYQLFLLNTERVAHYGRACGQRNHTDQADAGLIAGFIAQHDATPWQPPPPEQKALRSLTRARSQIVACIQALTLQCQTASGPALPHLQSLLRAARRELLAIERSLAAHLKAHPFLCQQVQRLMTINGIGLVSAALLVAELPPITEESEPRAIAAWAGLVPRRWQSGPREWTSRLSRKGNAYVRQALYMPALVAKRHNPLLRAFAAKLAAQGKSSGAILGALSHKLLRIAVGLLRTNTDFQPNWCFEKN